jgi:hypothetical protein
VIDRPWRLAERRSLDYHLEPSMSRDDKTNPRSRSQVPAKRARRVAVPDPEIRPALREHLRRRDASETDTVFIGSLA